MRCEIELKDQDMLINFFTQNFIADRIENKLQNKLLQFFNSKQKTTKNIKIKNLIY